MPKDKMSVEKAKQLYKKAHRGLSAKEEKAAHKAEKLLKKKKIKAKRNGKKFSFSDKKKLEEAKIVNKIRNAIKNKVIGNLKDQRSFVKDVEGEPESFNAALRYRAHQATGFVGDAVNKLLGKPTRKEREAAENAKQLRDLEDEFDKLNKKG